MRGNGFGEVTLISRTSCPERKGKTGCFSSSMNIFVKNVYVCVAFSLHTNLAVIELTWANPGFSLCACASVLGGGVGGGGSE